MEDLVLELKKKIIEVLNLEEVKPEDIDENAPLFGRAWDLIQSMPLNLSC